MTTKTDDQERAAFEAWYVTQTAQERDWRGWGPEHDQYGAKHSRLSWAAWQARAAVEADRQSNDTMLAHEWIRPALNLPDDAPYRFDYYAQKIGELMADRHGRMPSDDLHTLQSLLAWSEAQICMHEETRRGGTNWEICDQCGAKWADDEGGKPEFQWPEPIVKASALLSRYGSSQPVASARTDKMVWCACGDGYPADSYGAGFIDAAGHCENCDAAEHAVQEAASGEPVRVDCGECPNVSAGCEAGKCLHAAPVAQEPVAYWLEVNGEHRSIVTSKFQADEHAKMGGGVRLLVFGDAAPIAAQPSVPEKTDQASEITRLRSALEHLIERADDSDEARFGTLSTSFVRDIARAALSEEQP